MILDTFTNESADTDKHVCPDCHKTEYMAGARKGCADCRTKREEARVSAVNGKTREMRCDFCGKTVHGGQGKAAHERACDSNPKNQLAAIAEQESCPDSIAELEADRVTLVDMSGNIVYMEPRLVESAPEYSPELSPLTPEEEQLVWDTITALNDPVRELQAIARAQAESESRRPALVRGYTVGRWLKQHCTAPGAFLDGLIEGWQA